MWASTMTQLSSPYPTHSLGLPVFPSQIARTKPGGQGLTVEALVSRSLTRAFSSGGGI